MKTIIGLKSQNWKLVRQTQPPKFKMDDFRFKSIMLANCPVAFDLIKQTQNNSDDMCLTAVSQIKVHI